MRPRSVDVHAHALVPGAEALVAGLPELAQARAEEARGAGPAPRRSTGSRSASSAPRSSTPRSGWPRWTPPA